MKCFQKAWIRRVVNAQVRFHGQTETSYLVPNPKQCTMVAQPSYADASPRCYNEPGPEDMTALGCAAGDFFFVVTGLLRGFRTKLVKQARTS